MTQDDTQQRLPLSFGVHHAPRDEDVATVAAMLDDDAEVLTVMMAMGGAKSVYVARYCGISEGYVSRMKKGKRPIPDSLVPRLCAATGSNLLRQVRNMRKALGMEGRAQQIAYALTRQAA